MEMEESTWFNGEMNVPLKQFRLEYQVAQCRINLKAEFRRNSWQKPSWYKNLYLTDVYLWGIELHSDGEFADFELHKRSSLGAILHKNQKMEIIAQDEELLALINQCKPLHELFATSHSPIQHIYGKDNKVSTHFNTVVDHQHSIERVLKGLEGLGICLGK